MGNHRSDADTVYTNVMYVQIKFSCGQTLNLGEKQKQEKKMNLKNMSHLL